MAGFFNASKAVPTPRYTSIDVQTSAQGLCIPIGWGEFRASWNLIWAGRLKSVPAGGGKGGGKGGGGKGGHSYNYSMPIIAAICEGVVSDIDLVFINNGYSTLAGLNLTLFTGTQVQTPPGYVTSNYPTQALSYAGTAYVFCADFQLGTQPSLPSFAFQVKGKFVNTYPIFPQANPADIISDFITNTAYGLDPGATYIDSASWTLYKNYCAAQPLLMSPYLSNQEQALSILQRWATLTNTWIFWSGTSLKFVPLGDIAMTNATTGGNYTPTLTVQYDLNYSHFIFDPTSEDPITVSIKDPLDLYNIVEVDISDPTNDFNNTPIRWQDQTLIDLYGQLPPQVISAPEITDTGMASILALLIGKRVAYLDKTYKFKLGYPFILLEPGDIVSLTDVHLGLDHFAVRITAVSELEDVLSLEAEPLPSGIGTAQQYANTPSDGGSPIDLYAIPSPVNTPAIYEPDPRITAGSPQVWICASGQTNWGGCAVFLSPDGTNYEMFGEITQPSIQGILVNPLADHADPDTVNTLTVDLTQCGLQMSTAVTHAMADALQTSSLIDSEVLSFGTAALVGTNQYGLTYLRRGIYNTNHAAHSVGHQFTILDPKVAMVITLPPAYVGIPVHVKLCSFNQFGNEQEDISGVTDYVYTPTGVAYTIAAPGNLRIVPSNIVLPNGATSIQLNFSWSASSGPMVGYYIVQWSTDNVNWTGTTTTSLAYTLPAALANTNYWLRVATVSQSGLATSAFVTVGPINSGSIIVNVTPPAVVEGRPVFTQRRTHLMPPAVTKPVL